MSPAQLLAQLKRGNVPGVMLFLGPEAYGRRRLKQAMTERVPTEGMSEHDLTHTTLAEVLDDARALSLFATERLIWVWNAEAALPRGRAAEDEAEASSAPPVTGAAPLAAYVKDPTPGVTLVFEAARFDFEGDDKRRQDRVRKFYGAIPNVVELRRYALHEARAEAENLVRQAAIRIDAAALDVLVEALGGDMARIATEIEKLAVYSGERALGAEEVAALVPDARAVTIFALVNALGRRDRARSLETLDTLVKQGEYLPLILAFLSTQFRMALTASEAGLRGAGQIQTHFTKIGVPMWQSRAEQIQQTVTKFNRPQIESAVKLLFRTDTGLRDARPDDRTIMEQFVIELTR